MNILDLAIQDCLENEISFCKFIAANDTGLTGSHQAGIYIAKESWEILFDQPGIKGSNKDKLVKIKWQDTLETDSRFIYYGRESRNEYRITRFGKKFPFLHPEQVGNLFILIKIDAEYYNAYILSADEEIETFFSEMGITALQTNRVIKNTISDIPNADNLTELFDVYIKGLDTEFPNTKELSAKARELYDFTSKYSIHSPDDLLLNWYNTEYDLFRAIENYRYKDRISKFFNNVEELVNYALKVLNRRKSRAGKSLENQLSAVFNKYELIFEEQVVTENNKKPDFIFPGSKEYHDINFNKNKLHFLAAKTTCKDRWRQILNEADKIEVKHLFTLQQGISENQLKEMFQYKVQLVVPKRHLSRFPQSFQDKIMTLEKFIILMKSQ